MLPTQAVEKIKPKFSENREV